MSNLLDETIAVLADNGHTTNDVVWVGSRDGEYELSWAEFALIADIRYDEGYGDQEIANDLVVVGAGWWLERGEYDGSEWWAYQTQPQRKQSEPKPFTRVKSEFSWRGLGEMNK